MGTEAGGWDDPLFCSRMKETAFQEHTLVFYRLNNALGSLEISMPAARGWGKSIDFQIPRFGMGGRINAVMISKSHS